MTARVLHLGAFVNLVAIFSVAYVSRNCKGAIIASDVLSARKGANRVNWLQRFSVTTAFHLLNRSFLSKKGAE